MPRGGHLGLAGDHARRMPAALEGGRLDTADGGSAAAQNVGPGGLDRPSQPPRPTPASGPPSSSPSSSFWLSRMMCCGCWCGNGDRRRPVEESEYEVLIHGGSQFFGADRIRLSDPRLRPRIPIWLVLMLVLLFLAGVLCVFFLVPRGMGFGSTQINVGVISVNKTLFSYKLIVKVDLPISNYNYVDAYLSGNITMLFYKAKAGVTKVNKTRIPKRTKNKVITATVDASFVPYQYIETVLDHCIIFPHELVFFVDGSFEGQYLGQRQTLSLDTYTFVQCPNWSPPAPENELSSGGNSTITL